MATTKTTIPTGSAPWLVQQRRDADELVDSETQEFEYSVRNEVEWLYEHMSEVLTKKDLYVGRARYRLMKAPLE